MRSRPVHVVIAVVYAVAVLCVAFWPSPVDGNVDVLGSWPVRALVWLGLAPIDGYDTVEFAANVVLFVPFGWVAMALVPRATWWAVTSCACLASASVEVGQQLLRPERYATTSDVIANTLGAFIGSLLAAWVLGGRPTSGARHVAVSER